MIDSEAALYAVGPHAPLDDTESVTIMEPTWLSRHGVPMPATITLKNIPDDVYERLKDAAQAHHRSLNSEIIACLERVLTPTRVSAEERLARARRLRAGSAQMTFDADEIARARRQGRE